MLRVLAIDDNVSDVRLISEVLPPKSFTVHAVHTLSDGLTAANYDVVLLDLDLPDSNGLATLEAFVDAQPDAPVVVLTGSSDCELEAVHYGAQDYFDKDDIQDGRALARVLRYAVERKRMTLELEEKAQRLASSRTLFGTVINHNADGVLMVTANGVVKYANLAAQKMFGQSRSKLVGQPFPYPFKDTTVTREILCDEERGIYAEMRIAETIYERRPLYIVSLRDSTASHELDEVRGLKNDLERERNRLNMMFEVASEGIVVLDRAANILETNAAFKRILHISTMASLRENFFNLVEASNRKALHAQIERCYQEGWVCNFRFQMVRRDGVVVPCVLNASILRFNTDEPRLLAFVTDITAQVEAEERLIRSETLAVVGTLAAGVAHEFNNILAVIRGHLDSLILQPHVVSKQVRSQLDIMLRMVERGSEITNNMMMFTREGSNGHKPANLAELVNECVQLLSKDFKSEGIEFVVDVADDLEAFVNPSQICQVVMNLLLNAKDSMLESAFKRVTICSGHDDTNCWLTISDTGCGIEPDDMRQLFNPFFSTKGEKAVEGSAQASLRGTGLGLAVCHTIMTKHHAGDISVESQVGVGTTFKLTMPTYIDQITHDEEESIQDVPLGRGERVLVLDDETELANVIGNVLQGGGYETLVTDDGRKALEVHSSTPFDVVLMDLKMPIMSGYTFLNGLRESGRVPRIIIATGNPALLRGDTAQMGVDAILIKPFKVKDVFQNIRRVLDGGDSERNDTHVDCCEGT